jgi:hypothetical protein
LRKRDISRCSEVSRAAALTPLGTGSGVTNAELVSPAMRRHCEQLVAQMPLTTKFLYKFFD